jgi:hypothetical protein
MLNKIILSLNDREIMKINSVFFWIKIKKGDIKDKLTDKYRLA